MANVIGDIYKNRGDCIEAEGSSSRRYGSLSNDLVAEGDFHSVAVPLMHYPQNDVSSIFMASTLIYLRFILWPHCHVHHYPCE